MNKYNKTETDSQTENKLVATRGRGLVGRGKGQIGEEN